MTAMARKSKKKVTPLLAVKHTPKGGTARTYVVPQLNDLTPADTSAMRRQTGLSVAGTLKAFGSDGDLDLLVALMWLARRVEGDLTADFDQMLTEVGYGDTIEVLNAADLAGDTDEDADPEA